MVPQQVLGQLKFASIKQVYKTRNYNDDDDDVEFPSLVSLACFSCLLDLPAGLHANVPWRLRQQQQQCLQVVSFHLVFIPKFAAVSQSACTHNNV